MVESVDYKMPPIAATLRTHWQRCMHVSRGKRGLSEERAPPTSGPHNGHALPILGTHSSGQGKDVDPTGWQHGETGSERQVSNTRLAPVDFCVDGSVSVDYNRESFDGVSLSHLPLCSILFFASQLAHSPFCIMLQTHCACQAKAAAAAAATAAASASNMTLSNVTAMPSTNLPPSGMGPFVHFVPYSEYVFFEWWNATTPALFWITFVLLLLLAIGYEMLVYYRTKLEKSVASRLQKKDYAGRANE